MEVHVDLIWLRVLDRVGGRKASMARGINIIVWCMINLTLLDITRDTVQMGLLYAR